jgi:2-furoyl-CoA dehydrogenase 2Fe-2S iron sulfur subunit
MRVNADTTFVVNLKLNGRDREASTESRTQLCDFLRHDLGATGVHVGCEHGVCGACTVLVDGVAMRSCLMLAVQSHERRIDTVESLAEDDVLSDLQQAFRRHHALQCGFCTAGILMSCVDFLERVPDPDETQVRDMLSGHLCRCTGYTGMVRAVLEVAQQRQTNLEVKQ